MKIKFCWRHIFEICMTYNPYLESLTKFGPDRFCRFDVYWIQTDSTDKQTNKQNRQTSQIFID